MTSLDLDRDLRASQRFLVQALLARGVEVELLDRRTEAVVARYEGHVEYLLDVAHSGFSGTAVVAGRHKFRTKSLLRQSGLSVPDGLCFAPQALEAAVKYAGDQPAAVIKPNEGVGGVDVFMDVDSEAFAREALEAVFASEYGPTALVEEQVEGTEYRVFITRDGDYAVLERTPAFVVGDGVSTIRQLAKRATDRRMNPRVNCLCPIALDGQAERHLEKSGLSFDSVPEQSAQVFLRKNSNVSTGGLATDVTDAVHPDVIEICSRALAAIPGLPFAGIDFMTADIRDAPDSYAIIEINTQPGIGMHEAPSAGSGRTLSDIVADLIFPETAQKRGFGAIPPRAATYVSQ